MDDPKLIVERYTNRLLALIRKRLSMKLRPRLDEEDVLQSVYGSFFAKESNVLDGDSLWPYLAKMAINKSREAARRQSSEIRDTSRETDNQEALVDVAGKRPAQARRLKRNRRAIEGVSQDIKSDSFFDDETIRCMMHGATQQDAAYVVEVFESLPDSLRTVASLKLKSHTDQEIAGIINRSVRTVQRKVAVIKEIWGKEN